MFQLTLAEVFCMEPFLLVIPSLLCDQEQLLPFDVLEYYKHKENVTT